jgi:hypothetical protein
MFLWIYMHFTSCRQNTQNLKNLISLRPLELSDFHNYTLNPNKQVPESKNSQRHAPGSRGRLAAGDVGPGLANKWPRTSIAGTTDLLVEDLRRSPATAAAAAPRPARWGPAHGEVRRCELLCVLGKMFTDLGGGESGRGTEFTEVAVDGEIPST